MEPIIIIDEEITFRKPQTFTISNTTHQTLRKIWLESMKKQQEIASFFEALEKPNSIELIIPQQKNQISFGRRESTYTVCMNEDKEYTFHTHPVEFDKNGWPQNYPNLISNEDMIGCVQDHYANPGYLSNVNGKNVFDVLLCPMGIFVYSAKRKIIEKWVELEDKIDIDNIEEYVRLFNPRFRLQKYLEKSNDIQALEQKVKHWIQTNTTERNPFWATEENALMNNGFNKYIGSWYYTNKGKGIFAEVMIKNFKTLGYEYWFKKKPKDEISDTSTDEHRANATFEDQMRFFTSDEFFKINFHQSKKLQKYLKLMNDLGYYCKFFNWTDRIEFTI